MSTFIQMKSDLTLLGMANLVALDLAALINKVQREEVENWDWSFLSTNIVINSVLPYTAGAITVTNGSTTVNGIGLATFRKEMEGWFLRVGATLTTPVIIQTFNGPHALELLTPWGGPSLFVQQYTLFPLYYSVQPLIEVHRVRQISFLTETSQEALNRIDPSRLSTGGNPALRWSPSPFDTAGNFQIELWPSGGVAPLPYLVDGKAGPIDLVLDNDLPQIPSAVIEAKAAMYMCRAVFASSGNPKWLQLAQEYRQDYIQELQDARVADNRRKVTLGMSATGSRGGVNLGLDYLAVHDAGGPPYAGAGEL